MITLFQKKSYQGVFETQEEAADVYDRVSILVFGTKVFLIELYRIGQTKSEVYKGRRIRDLRVARRLRDIFLNVLRQA